MTKRDPEVDKFNESVRQVQARHHPRAAASLSTDRIDPGTGFKVYSVSTSGQLTLPSPARAAWLLNKGGKVHIAHFGDFVIIVRVGYWSRVLEEYRLDEQLAKDLQAEIDGQGSS